MGWFSKKIENAKAAVETLNENSIPAPAEPAPAMEVLALPRSNDGDWFPNDVVGESRYTKNIRDAIGKKGGEKNMWLTLSREPENQYDPNAIRVHIQGATVGYVPREDTEELQELLQAAERRNMVAMAWGRVWYSGDGGDPYGAVKFDVGDVVQAWPVNDKPDEATSAIWPKGRKLKVSVDDEMKSVVQDALSKAFIVGKCIGYLKLDFTEGAKKMTVSFDGVPFGTLSPAASNKMGEILKVAEGAGRSIYVIGEFTGNAVIAEAKVLVKPPEELTNEEINQLAAPAVADGWAPPPSPAESQLLLSNIWDPSQAARSGVKPGSSAAIAATSSPKSMSSPR